MATSRRSTATRLDRAIATSGRDKWRSNVLLRDGRLRQRRELTPAGSVNKSSESWTFNTWYTPLPKLDIGAEFRHAVRELENGDDGSLDRLQFTTKYSF